MQKANNQQTVVVAMSGGVDSSVAAALLVEQGYRVIGMMLRLWSEPGAEAYNRCCTPEAMSLARRVAHQLEIPFYALDIRETFQRKIVQPFINDYLQGVTPNPCLSCNRQIRFGALLEHARTLGANYLATGHYARLRVNGQGKLQLLAGVDNHKDQSYVLSVLNQSQLSQALFPVGEYSKPQVRELAQRFALPVAERSDSQDLCFLAGDDYRNFLRRQAPQVENPGVILNRQGEVLGKHRGLAFYTIGQRKGLGVSGAQPLYVLEKDLERNALLVGELEELGSNELTASAVNWISGTPPDHALRVEIKIRYKARPAWGLVTALTNDRVRVNFEQPLRDITPGQAAVFYDGEVCLGGGIIQS